MACRSLSTVNSRRVGCRSYTKGCNQGKAPDFLPHKGSGWKQKSNNFTYVDRFLPVLHNGLRRKSSSAPRGLAGLGIQLTQGWKFWPLCHPDILCYVHELHISFIPWKNKIYIWYSKSHLSAARIFPLSLIILTFWKKNFIFFPAYSLQY